MKGMLKSLGWGIIFAGIIIFAIGCYYAVLEAGIPFQDPTLEMQIEYAINMGIGKVLTKCGGIIFLGGLLLRIILSVIYKGASNKKTEGDGENADGAGNN